MRQQQFGQWHGNGLARSSGRTQLHHEIMALAFDGSAVSHPRQAWRTKHARRDKFFKGRLRDRFLFFRRKPGQRQFANGYQFRRSGFSGLSLLRGQAITQVQVDTRDVNGATARCDSGPAK